MRPNRHPLDEDSASRLLQGLVHPDDAPPGYGAVAGLLTAAAELPVRPVDEDAAATTVSAMVDVIRDATPAPEISRRRSMLGKLLAGKALAAVAVVGLTATGAAAATGSLPDPAQGVVSDVVSHVGVNIPHPNHGKSAGHRQDGKHDDAGDDQGQSGDSGQSGDENKGLSDFVHTTKDSLPDGAKLGPIVCAKASDNHCQAGDNHGNGTDDQGTPPANPSEGRGKSGEEHPAATDEHATTPTTGSIATGEEHSGHSELPAGEGKPE